MLLDVCGLLGLDRPGGEEVLSLGDRRPDVDGGILALAVRSDRLVGSGDRREGGCDVLPGHFVERPVAQRIAAPLVVDEPAGGAEVSCEVVQCGRDGSRVSGLVQPLLEVVAGLELQFARVDAEIPGRVAKGSAACPLDEQERCGSPQEFRCRAGELGEMPVIPGCLRERRDVFGLVVAVERGPGALRTTDLAEGAGQWFGCEP